MWKKHKLVVLPTKDNSKFGKIYENNTFHFYTNENTFLDNLANCQHLYILSNEEIKEGDWICYDSKDIYQFEKSNNSKSHDVVNTLKEKYKKVMATTDPKLHKEGIPDIPIEFQQEWVKNPQEEIEVEYKSTLHIGEEVDDSYPKYFPLEVIKLTNNSINCRLIEDSWDDIEDIFYSRNDFSIHETKYDIQMKFYNWLKENYEVPKPLKK